MLIDARSVDSGSVLRFDTCVVGGGPAGIAIATALGARGTKVALLEAGGFRPRIRDHRMNLGAVTGTDYWNLASIRFRLFGGSGTRWGGICRRLDPLDVEPRDWVERSGWPIGFDELERHYPAAAHLLELDDSVPASGPDLGRTDLTDVQYHLSPVRDFGERWRPRLERDDNVTLIINANVLLLNRQRESRRIDSVDVRTFTGRDFGVAAQTFVLASGAIENARLLLASDGLATAATGTCFMEHVNVPIATLRATSATRSWTSYRIDPPHQPRLVHAVAPRPDVQRERRLLNATIAVGPRRYSARPPFVDWDARLAVPAERLYRHLVDLPTGRMSATTLNRARDYWNRRHNVDPAAGREDLKLLFYRGEQAPDPANRVYLGGARDGLGQRRAELHWRVSDLEWTNALAVLALFKRAAQQNDWGTVSGPLEGWQRHVIGGPHHMGTTRMSIDAQAGVVDKNCRVHGIANLYVAGSSVFPTGGHANPTWTVIALALRLAEHLT